MVNTNGLNGLNGDPAFDEQLNTGAKTTGVILFSLALALAWGYRVQHQQVKRRVFLTEHRERERDYSGWETRQRAKYR